MVAYSRELHDPATVVPHYTAQAYVLTYYMSP